LRVQTEVTVKSDKEFLSLRSSRIEEFNCPPWLQVTVQEIAVKIFQQWKPSD
jgi:hypothetical protein